MDKVVIENSTVIVGCSGEVSVENKTLSELETELLRIFRSVSIRERVSLIQQAYEYEKSPGQAEANKKPIR